MAFQVLKRAHDLLLFLIPEYRTRLGVDRDRRLAAWTMYAELLHNLANYTLIDFSR